MVDGEAAEVFAMPKYVEDGVRAALERIAALLEP
jgi:hypothetical protein